MLSNMRMHLTERQERLSHAVGRLAAFCRRCPRRKRTEALRQWTRRSLLLLPRLRRSRTRSESKPDPILKRWHHWAMDEPTTGNVVA